MTRQALWFTSLLLIACGLVACGIWSSRSVDDALVSVDAVRTLSLGERIANLELKDLDRKTITAVFANVDGDSNSNASPVVLAWTGLGCPMAQVFTPRLDKIAQEYASRGIRFFQIHSNSQDSVQEIRDSQISRPVSFPIILDASGHLAKRFGATRTTDVVVLSREGRFVYHGAVDDQYGFRLSESQVRVSYRRDQPSEHYLRDTLEAILAGKPVPRPSTNAHGCALGLPYDASESVAKADATTFHEDIEPLLQKHCQECHRPGSIGPFPLLSYEDAKGWARTLAEVVGDGVMPPWHADPKIGKFSNDRSMEEEEILAFAAWSEAGAPRGNPAAAPPARAWPEGWSIGEPDVVFDTPEFTVPAEGRVPYRYVPIETDFEEDRWVQAAEFSSTSPEVVHHVLSFVKESRRQRRKNDRPWRPRFRPWSLLQGGDPKRMNEFLQRSVKHAKHMSVGNAGGLDGFFVGAAAGDAPLVFPDGRAKLLPAGGTIMLQIHYTPNGAEQKTRTKLALKFAKSRPAEVLESHGIATVAFSIPPGAPDHKVSAVHRFQRDGVLIAMGPHMHLRGKAFTFEARFPDGSKEVLLHVPNYDFDWQPPYVLAEPRRIPKGTALHVTGVYDNSADNPDNPDPTKEVFFGLQSDEEMMIGYFEVLWDQDASN